MKKITLKYIDKFKQIDKYDLIYKYIGPSVIVIFLIVIGFVSNSKGNHQTAQNEYIGTISNECVKFYREKRSDPGKDIEYIGHWEKSGKLVIALSVKKYSYDTSYTKGFCIVDMKEGTFSLPSIFDQHRWEK